MIMIRNDVLIILLGVCVSVHARCHHVAMVEMPFVVEYSVWRGWQHVVIYTVNLKPTCGWAIASLVKCLNVNGVAASVNLNKISTSQSRLGIVILSPSLMRRTNTDLLSNTLNKIAASGLNTGSYDWLLMTRSAYEIKLINSVLNETAVRFDHNIIAIYPSSVEKNKCESSCSNAGYNNSFKSKFKKYNCTDCQNKIRYATDKHKKLPRGLKKLKCGKITPNLGSGITNAIHSRSFRMFNATSISLKKQFVIWSQSLTINISYHSEEAHVVQYFKVRVNSTLYAAYLGAWLQDRSFSLVHTPYSIEERNFLGEALIVGRSNSSGGGVVGIDDEKRDSPALLDDLLDFLNNRLNATSVKRYYGKLGFRTYEGAWTGLLGALMDSLVDISMEPVTALTSQYQDMDFVFPIAETMCNIYIRHQETSAVRDIFLAPFSGRLVVCVVAVAVVAAITLGVLSRVAVFIKDGHETRTMGCTESLLWSIGILCQQGGQWTPSVPAASIVLIVCLLFAVVTYNAYAAFITSVLSVRVPSVATISDVLQSSNIKIGYIRNGADQMYLMSTKDVQLNAFYIRGYSEAENLVSSAEEGLARAAMQDYAFFTGQLTARGTISKLSQARGRCALRELPVPSTRAQLAFPLPRGSPYARPILISLLQLRSSGVLAKLETALVPPLPHCAPPSGFASARAADVRSAFLLMLIGLLASLIIGTAEFCWKKRMQLRRFFFKFYRRLISLY